AGALAPKGPGARRAEFEFWLMTTVSAAIFVLVCVVLVWGMIRRPKSGEQEGYGRSGRLMIFGGGIAMPVVVLLGLMGVNVYMLAAEPEQGDLVLEVTGYQFWWEFHYPELGVVTANEVHIPVGRRVELRVTSVDVIHSFWVPELHGKIDVFPGRTNTWVIEAEEPGVYRGQCAEFCGLQHANMALYVIADEPAVFDAWAEHEAAPASPPTTALARLGLRVMQSSSCAGCHAVRGTTADGQLGPDLTHFASRETIGAGTVPNDRGHLAGWLLDAQAIKPGSLMPPVPLAPDDLHALVEYIETLE
ncbi:MAG: cytochrome c oxidase subunit II, partial [Actinomycetota bacterium]|nr:cytochrome c oxidase subunit II [Actinomycetota bacterium]